LSAAAVNDLEVHQSDVKTAYLNSELKEEIYIRVPEGLCALDSNSVLCKLNKMLYGLKQAER